MKNQSHSIYADYFAHCIRAEVQGFKQLPLGRFIMLVAKL